MITDEPRSWAPLWLEFSGLPQQVAQKTKASAGWPLLKKVIELDCERNPQPGTVEITLIELHDRTGVSPDAARKAIESLRKLKLLACFLPDNDEEPSLFRLHVPLPTPKTFDEVLTLFPDRLPVDSKPGRYSQLPTESQDESKPVNRSLQETVDLYFDTVGLKMNAFILDELRILVDLFTIEDIKRTFRRARKNEIRSLRWVVQELSRKGKATAPSPPETSDRISHNES